ncbi:tripartite tricarboxylate transporter permease [Natranaerofaba carboxydovora]|uniref:tripartite tricarboxylate transporter permease n=1 Tax=Natranaerofaba carboxydovora TaxID=2742683 RepID=UPI001F1474BB|nr:tripartite tricarboxylate transporter permease [Natranaerofaba carboxydovora]UMZ72818.1 Tripartite tricarboxylate transporter TctA family protein [Natranaerofaba carboxydovora]
MDILIVFVGVLGGIMVGAMPGLTPTMGVALLVPFTFYLSVSEGLTLLGAVYVGSVYGGAITAILVNIPGAPASIATILDGHPMAKKGQPVRAIHLATVSSFVGGVIGVLLLIFFSPALSRLSLSFGPAEQFWVAMFGITIIAALSVGSVIKGLIGGVLGILLSTVGISSITGTPRFTFGLNELIGGVHPIAALIGLFALSQGLCFVEKIFSTNGESETIDLSSKSTSIKEVVAEILKSKKMLGLGTSIGSLIGLIPGAGGQIASLVAYNEAKRASNKKEEFGEGCSHGIITAESANNAMVGTSLIPLLTLGIPGSPTAAVLLGGLLMNGLWPGPGLFDENAAITYTFLYGMLGAQFFLLGIGLFGGKYFGKITQIPSHIMAPAIFIFCVIGSFAIRNNVGDIIVMLVLGVIMYFLQKIDFNPAPIALGLILGEYAEQGLLLAWRDSVAHSSLFSYFMDRPIVILFMVMSVLSVAFTVFWEYKKQKKCEAS